MDLIRAKMARRWGTDPVFARYAVFFTCDPEHALARFGAAWLGWDSAAGCEVVRPDVVGFDVADVTAAPHKYGLHGTIKAPFRLAPGYTEADLIAGFDGLCAGLAPAALPGLHLAFPGRFMALVPKGDTQALNRLAGRVVQDLDPFRAALTDTEIAQRNPDRLTPAQKAHLDAWGYPFVMDDFRFHITLTDRLPKATGRDVFAELERRLSAIEMPEQVDSLTLMGEGPDGRFHQIRRGVPGQSVR